MKRPRPVFLRLVIPVGVAAIALCQVTSSSYQRYLRCQSKADNFAIAESVYRQRAGVREELAPRLREVATLARELARSSTGDFERKKWLEMANADEKKADEAEREAAHLMSLADDLGARAYKTSQLAWRPWLAEP